MKEIYNFIGSLVVLVLLGAFTTFLVILNTKKEEFWEEIYKKMVKKNETNNEIDDCSI